MTLLVVLGVAAGVLLADRLASRPGIEDRVDD